MKYYKTEDGQIHEVVAPKVFLRRNPTATNVTAEKGIYNQFQEQHGQIETCVFCNKQIDRDLRKCPYCDGTLIDNSTISTMR